jgi:sulfite exporter TauE/SafE
LVAALAGRALLLGLASGLFCAGLCLPLLGPVALSQPGSFRRSLGRVALFLGGRLAAYVLFGVVFGALGGALARFAAAKAWLLPAVYGALGVAMVGYGLVQSFPHVGFCRVLAPRVQSGWYVAALGFLAGINLCPPFLLAVTTVVDAGGVLRGMLFFFIFFIATSVYLVPVLAAGFAGRFASVRFAARVASVLAGCYFVLLAARVLAIR